MKPLDTSPETDLPSSWDMQALLEEWESRLDEVFERLTRCHSSKEGHAALEAVVPDEVLSADAAALFEFLYAVFSEYDEIDGFLAELREEADEEGWGLREGAVAVVSEQTLERPDAVSHVLDPKRTQRRRFEALFREAMESLERLDVYSLSRRSPEEVVDLLRTEERLRVIQYIVEFLRALYNAADSFEKLELPSAHIRDYLEYLYRMKDWTEMEFLVRRLEMAVAGYLRSLPTEG